MRMDSSKHLPSMICISILNSLWWSFDEDDISVKGLSQMMMSPWLHIDPQSTEGLCVELSHSLWMREWDKCLCSERRALQTDRMMKTLMDVWPSTRKDCFCSTVALETLTWYEGAGQDHVTLILSDNTLRMHGYTIGHIIVGLLPWGHH